MAGISSKAAGKTENKKKYDGYEFNSDFDINLYETYYRSHDPQIGKFLQIDPKANNFESPYASMGNNPISNNDPLGDIVYFYDSKGKLIKSRTDGNDYATITVVTDENLPQFEKTEQALIEVQQMLAKFNINISDEIVTGAMQATGVSYDSKEYFDYHDKHSKDYYQGKEGGVYQPKDGKGKLMNEHAATTNIEAGYMRIDQDSDQGGSPGDSYPKYGIMGVHAHFNDDRIFLYPNQEKILVNSNNSPGKAALGWDLINSAGSTNCDPSRGKFRTVVTNTHIYLYTSSGVMIAIDRKQVPSQNPNEIK